MIPGEHINISCPFHCQGLLQVLNRNGPRTQLCEASACDGTAENDSFDHPGPLGSF